MTNIVFPTPIIIKQKFVILTLIYFIRERFGLKLQAKIQILGSLLMRQAIKDTGCQVAACMFFDHRNFLALAYIPELDHDGFQYFFNLILLHAIYLERDDSRIRVWTGEHTEGNKIAAALRNCLGQSC